MVVAAYALAYPVSSLPLTCPVSVSVALFSLKAASRDVFYSLSLHVALPISLSPTLASPVARLRVTPFSTTLVEAFTTVTPGVEQERTPEHSRDANTAEQVVRLRQPGPLTML